MISINKTHEKKWIDESVIKTVKEIGFLTSKSIQLKKRRGDE
ncbi:hypothetical protein GCM10007867_32660 [Gluconobacter cerinus]|uniref:Uncharacterized protein n=1 Tax=Gluconobacter cerinus TaxID=38307 RepID=A0AAV5NJE9_9PROT|nr:hypothetical protein GCM10007867_32660 [Gluconobacter cerinus]